MFASAGSVQPRHEPHVNELASSNIEVNSVLCDMSQPVRSWLKCEAWLNMFWNVVHADTSHPPMAWLKFVAA